MIDNTQQEWTVKVTPDEKAACMRLLHDMRAEAALSAPSAKDTAKCKRLLPSPQQVALYKDCVRAYYIKHIAERSIPHKTLMIHWAAVYQAIADRVGINEFYGPDYDHFLYNICNIQYNDSAEKKGRYKQVGNVYRHYRKLLVYDDIELESKAEECDLSQYRQFWKNMKKELYYAIEKPRNYTAAQVPQKTPTL